MRKKPMHNSNYTINNFNESVRGNFVCVDSRSPMLFLELPPRENNSYRDPAMLCPDP